MTRPVEEAPAFTGSRTTHVERDRAGRILSYVVSPERSPSAAEPEAGLRRDRNAAGETLRARLLWLARQSPRGWLARQSPRAADNRRRLEDARRSANPPGVADNRKRLAAVR